jgi:hypothetical protein
MMYLVCVGCAAFFFDWLEKMRFLGVAQKAQLLKIIDPKDLPRLRGLIESVDSNGIFSIIFIAAICTLMIWFALRLSTKLNWAWATTLPKAVSFSSAMNKIGIVDPFEQIDFVRKHKLPVYIALSPVLSEEQKDVRAKLYVFAHHDTIYDQNVFTNNIGRRTLCLDAEDYESIAKDGKQRFSLAESALLMEKDKELESVNAESLRQKTDIVRLTKANEDLQKQLHTSKAREGKGIKEIRESFPLWQAAVPMIARLKSEGRPGEYTRPLIQQAFDNELAQHPELQQTVRVLLGSDDCILPDWFMEAVRRELGNLVNKKGGNLKA